MLRFTKESQSRAGKNQKQNGATMETQKPSRHRPMNTRSNKNFPLQRLKIEKVTLKPYNGKACDRNSYFKRIRGLQR